MESNKIRQAFLDFFESKGHAIVPSAPMVVKGEYYLGVRCWWVFLVMGIVAIAASVAVRHILWSTLLAVWGASSLWSIGELFEQRQRVAKGWFPANPKRQGK